MCALATPLDEPSSGDDLLGRPDLQAVILEGG
jgi:hypothetical protein